MATVYWKQGRPALFKTELALIIRGGYVLGRYTITETSDNKFLCLRTFVKIFLNEYMAVFCVCEKEKVHSKCCLYRILS